jgi:hypothetical protein
MTKYCFVLTGQDKLRRFLPIAKEVLRLVILLIKIFLQLLEFFK